MLKKTMSPRRQLRYYWLRLLRLRGSPFFIARGIAIGAFVGVTPTIPFHTILTLFLCAVCRANIIAAIAINWIVSNPITIPIEYYLSWKLGVVITGQPVSWDQVQQMLDELHSVGFFEAVEMIFAKFLQVLYCLIAGGLVLALPVGLLCYFLAVYFYFYRQKKKQERFLKSISRKKDED